MKIVKVASDYRKDESDISKLAEDIEVLSFNGRYGKYIVFASIPQNGWLKTRLNYDELTI